MDFTPTPADSTVVADWLSHVLAPLFSHVPPELVALSLGFLVSVIFHFAELLLVRYGAKLPGLDKVLEAWQARKSVVNPLLVLLLGQLTTGSWLVGVIGAGLRSFFKKPTPATVRGLAGAGALALMLLAPQAGSAGEYDEKPRLLHYDVTIGEKWLDIKHLDKAPLPFADVAVRYILPFQASTSVKLKVRHQLKEWSDQPWQPEVGLTYSF